MTIDQIREKLANKIELSSQWIDELNDTNPGHYGVEDWDVSLNHENIWVDIPKNTFTFKDANFAFDLRIGGSRDEDSSIMKFSKIATGKGNFSFSSKRNDVEIDEMELNFDLDLFSD
jgi:hypothetical protein